MLHVPVPRISSFPGVVARCTLSLRDWELERLVSSPTRQDPDRPLHIDSLAAAERSTALTALPPISVVELFTGEREALLTLLAGLSAAEWALPTACPGWSVHDLALHLLGDDVGRLIHGRDGYSGYAKFCREDRRRSVGVGRTGQLHQSAERGVGSRHAPHRPTTALRAPPHDWRRYEHVLCAPRSSGGRLAGRLGRSRARPGLADVAREYTERWVHQRHVRDAVGQTGLKEPRWFAPVLDTFVRALPHACGT